MSLLRLRIARFFPWVSVVTLSALVGCASTTIIQSQPPGARILLNGAVAGSTPYAMTDTKIVGSTTQVRLEYPGYQPLDVTIARSEELDVLPLIGGIFLLVPFLWIMKYQPTHMYELQPGFGPPPMGTAYIPAPAGAAFPPPATPGPLPQAPGPAGYPAPPPGYPPPAGYPPPRP